MVTEITDDVQIGEVHLLPDQQVGIHSRDGGEILAATADDGTAIGYCSECAKTWTLALKVVLTGGR